MANGIQKDLGKVTAYSYAKAAGYTGTEEQFQAIFNEFTQNAPGLIDRMDTAVARAEAAVTNIDATVQDAVDDAVEEATASAVATANQAVTDAQAAQAAAEGAVTQANAAVTQANSAVSAAQAAQAAAEDAAESFVLDRTLTDSGAAAPADLVGGLKESIINVTESVDNINSVVPKRSASGEIVHFTNGIAGAKFENFKISIVSERSGSGNASPTNKRAFTPGITSLNVYVSPTDQQADAEVTEITFPSEAGNVYRAEIDLNEKTLTVKSRHIILTGNGSEGISSYSGSRFRVQAPGFISPTSAVYLSELQSDILTTATKASMGSDAYRVSPSDSGKAELLIITETSINTVQGLNTWLQSNNVEIDYPLNTPVVYNLSDEMITMLEGENYVWSSSGTIELSFYANIDGLLNNINPDQCTFIEEQSYKNLFNPADSDIVSGSYIGNNGNLTAASDFLVSGYIPIKGGETYILPFYSNKFGTGTSARSIPLYDSNKNYTDYVTGTLISVDGTSSRSFLMFTFTQNTSAKYMRVNVLTKNVNSNEILSQYHTFGNFMVIEGSEFPTRFYPYLEQEVINERIYSGHENLNNPLYVKRAVFLGDSICEGDSQSGWAGRIGSKNTMLWENDGIGGSTISTALPSKAICTRAIMTENPDYIIFEGGTNDADHIGDATGETKPEAFGTWAEDNYGTDDAETYYGFNINTFCGAVDYLCKRLVSTYPSAKIGFIAAQKMGTSNSSRKNRGYYIQTAKEICHKWGISCVDLWNESHLNPLIPSHYTSGQTYLYSDGQHLTANGYEYITPIIEAWMKTL